MVVMRKMFEKVEIPPLEAAPAEFTPPIFAIAASVFIFLCFHSALLPRTLGGHIYSVFRSKYIDGRKNQAIWMINGQKSMDGVPYLPRRAT